MLWMLSPAAYMLRLNWSESDVNPERDRFAPPSFSTEACQKFKSRYTPNEKPLVGKWLWHPGSDETPVEFFCVFCSEIRLDAVSKLAG
jgi:hypothetical protein